MCFGMSEDKLSQSARLPLSVQTPRTGKINISDITIGSLHITTQPFPKISVCKSKMGTNFASLFFLLKRVWL